MFNNGNNGGKTTPNLFGTISNPAQPSTGGGLFGSSKSTGLFSSNPSNPAQPTPGIGISTGFGLSGSNFGAPLGLFGGAQNQGTVGQTTQPSTGGFGGIFGAPSSIQQQSTTANPLTTSFGANPITQPSASQGLLTGQSSNTAPQQNSGGLFGNYSLGGGAFGQQKNGPNLFTSAQNSSANNMSNPTTTTTQPNGLFATSMFGSNAPKQTAKGFATQPTANPQGGNITSTPSFGDIGKAPEQQKKTTPGGFGTSAFGPTSLLNAQSPAITTSTNPSPIVPGQTASTGLTGSIFNNNTTTTTFTPATSTNNPLTNKIQPELKGLFDNKNSASTGFGTGQGLTLGATTPQNNPITTTTAPVSTSSTPTFSLTPAASTTPSLMNQNPSKGMQQTTLTNPITNVVGSNFMNSQPKGMQQTKIKNLTNSNINPSTNQTQNSSPVANEQQRLIIELQKSNRTVGEFIDQWRRTLSDAYHQLQKNCQILKSYHNPRKQNYQIIANFKQLQPIISQSKSTTQLTLTHIEHRQKQFLQILNQIEQDVCFGYNQRTDYQHPLSQQIQDCKNLRKYINSEDDKYLGEKDVDASNLQLKNIFCNLDSVENQLRRLSHVLDHFFGRVVAQ